MSRRGFLTAAAGTAGAVAAAPLLAACGSGPAAKAGSTSQKTLTQILPTFKPLQNSGMKPDFASVNGSMPGYLSYPTTLVRTVTGTPGSGGTYTAVGPDWGAIPRTSGNTYYTALNGALGANVQWQPGNGTNYQSTLPPLFAGNKLPDWIVVPTWGEPTGFGQATQTALADLTPYLAGDKIHEYPNLAAISTAGWQQTVWDGKILGLPGETATFAPTEYLFYRADILDKLGLGTPSIKTVDDLYNLGKEINDPKSKRWAFDDLWTVMGLIFDYGASWYTDDKGNLITAYETDQIIEAMNWQRKIFAAGMVSPDAVAGNTGTMKQRFWSGQNVITGDGIGAWVGGDVTSGAAADKGYKQMEFHYSAADGGTARVPNAPPTQWVSYFNKNLKPAQIKELLRVANYLAAPYGTYEYTMVNYGAPNVDYTMTKDGPAPTATGTKDVVAVVPNLLVSADNVISNPGYPDITTAHAQFQQRNGKYLYSPPFYAMNITVPNNLVTAAGYGPFTTSTNIMYEVVRGRASINDYKSTVNEWLRNGGTKLKAFYESVRAKQGNDA